MRLSFDRSQTLVLTEAFISGPLGMMVADFAIDTGAAQTMSSEPLLGILGYAMDASRVVNIATAGGGVAVTELRVSRFSALGATVSGFPLLASVLPVGIDGLLGLDFLRSHRLVLDFREGTIDFD